MKGKIKKWIQKKPIDWKWIIILSLLREKIVSVFSWFYIYLGAMAGYPDLTAQMWMESFNRVSEIISNAFMIPLKIASEFGLEHAELIYPYNVKVAWFFSQMIDIFPLIMLVIIIYLIVHLILHHVFYASRRDKK